MEEAQIAARLRQTQAAYVAGMRDIATTKAALERARQDAVKAATEAGWKNPKIRKCLEEGNGGRPVGRQTVASIRDSITDRREDQA